MYIVLNLCNAVNVAQPQKVFHLAPISKIKCLITALSIFSLGGYWSEQWFGTFFGDWSQSEKLPEIKPTLANPVLSLKIESSQLFLDQACFCKGTEIQTCLYYFFHKHN